MHNKLMAIAANTFTETIRQPIYAVLLWAAAGLLILNPSIAAFSLETGGDNKIMIDIGLATLLLYGLMAAVFSAAGVITREIETFTVLTVISKPVSRPVFLVGKYLGVSAALAAGFYLLSLVLIQTVQQGVMESTADKFDRPVVLLSTLALGISLVVALFGNYTYGWHFAATLQAWATSLGTLAVAATFFFDRQWAFEAPAVPDNMIQVAFATIMVLLAVLVLAAFAVSISTRVSQVMTLTLCAGVFLLGLLADYYVGSRSSDGLPYAMLAAVAPNFQFFWLGDALTQEMPVEFSHVLRVGGYALTYIAAVLAIGVALFQTREVG